MNYLEQLENVTKLELDKQQVKKNEIDTMLIEAFADVSNKASENQIEVSQFILPYYDDALLMYVDVKSNQFEVVILENSVLPDDLDVNYSSEENREIITEYDFGTVYSLKVVKNNDKFEIADKFYKGDASFTKTLTDFVTEKLDLDYQMPEY